MCELVNKPSKPFSNSLNSLYENANKINIFFIVKGKSKEEENKNQMLNLRKEIFCSLKVELKFILKPTRMNLKFLMENGQFSMKTLIMNPS